MNVPPPRAVPEIRNQRLAREAAGNAEGLFSPAESIGKTFGVVLFALLAAVAFSGDLPDGEKAAKSAGERSATLARS